MAHERQLLAYGVLKDSNELGHKSELDWSDWNDILVVHKSGRQLQVHQVQLDNIEEVTDLSMYIDHAEVILPTLGCCQTLWLFLDMPHWVQWVVESAPTRTCTVAVASHWDVNCEVARMSIEDNIAEVL